MTTDISEKVLESLIAQRMTDTDGPTVAHLSATTKLVLSS